MWGALGRVLWSGLVLLGMATAVPHGDAAPVLPNLSVHDLYTDSDTSSAILAGDLATPTMDTRHLIWNTAYGRGMEIISNVVVTHSPRTATMTAQVQLGAVPLGAFVCAPLYKWIRGGLYQRNLRNASIYTYFWEYRYKSYALAGSIVLTVFGPIAWEDLYRYAVTGALAPMLAKDIRAFTADSRPPAPSGSAAASC